MCAEQQPLDGAKKPSKRSKKKGSVGDRPTAKSKNMKARS